MVIATREKKKDGAWKEVVLRKRSRGKKILHPSLRSAKKIANAPREEDRVPSLRSFCPPPQKVDVFIKELVCTKREKKKDGTQKKVVPGRKSPRPRNKKISHPPLRSFYLPPQEVDVLIKELVFLWAVTEFLPLYRDSIVPIVPLNNDARYSHQTPQALRFFFAAVERICADTAMMPIYGPMAILRSTGFHPSRDFKVRQFSNLLYIIKDLLEQRVKSSSSSKSTRHTYDDLDFNHLEVKLYQGKDIFKDPSTGEPLVNDRNEEVRDNCNKTVRLHTDLCFDDDGNQKETDTARVHPITTLTIGSPRKLTFVHKSKSKVRSGGWKKVQNSDDEKFLLEQGSVFVLLPDDEIPEAIGENLHKSQHRARFSGSGVSVALVFRSVRAKSLFHTKTDKWQWKRDPEFKLSIRKYLRSNAVRWIRRKNGQPSRMVSDGTVGKEIAQMEKNVTKAIYESLSPSSILTEANREAFLEQLCAHIQDKLGQHYGIALDDSPCPDDCKDKIKNPKSRKMKQKPKTKSKTKKKSKKIDRDRMFRRWRHYFE